MIIRNVIESNNDCDLIEIIEVDEDGNEKHLGFETLSHNPPSQAPGAIDGSPD